MPNAHKRGVLWGLAILLAALPSAGNAGDDLGVTVTLQSPAPQQVLTLKSVALTTEVTEGWRVLTPGVALINTRLVGVQTIGAVTLKVVPDRIERDRIYPALSRLGDGYVVYAPYLQTAEGASVSVDGVPIAIGESYVFIGPNSHIRTQTSSEVVIAPDAPQWLSELMVEQVSTAIDLYGRALGQPLENRPVVMVSLSSPGPFPYRADVKGNVIFFRLKEGGPWADHNPDIARALASVAFHESFHLWNGQKFTPAEGELYPWLHEGAAEYAALLAGVATGSMSPQTALDKVSEYGEKCRRALKSQGLVNTAIRQGNAVYACGVYVQWIADLQARKQNKTFFGIWKEVFERAGPRGTYTLADFRRIIDAPGSPLSLLLDGDSEGFLPRIDDSLAHWGAQASIAPTSAAYRSAVLQPLLRSHCGSGPRGYYTLADRVRLDTGAHCGVLSGGPAIVAVSGFDLFADAGTAYDAANARCSAGQPVILRRADGTDIKVPCAQALPEPQKSYQIAGPMDIFDNPLGGH